MLLAQVNAQKDSIRSLGKEAGFDKVAEALKTVPVFAQQAAQGAVATGAKVRSQYNAIMKKMKDDNDKAAFVSGVRESQYGDQIMRAVDEAITNEDEADEDRARLKASQTADLQRKEQQGEEVSLNTRLVTCGSQPSRCFFFFYMFVVCVFWYICCGCQTTPLAYA